MASLSAFGLAYVVVVCVGSVVALLGNCLVLVSVKKFEFLKTSSNYLVVMLAFNDLLLASGFIGFAGELECCS